MNTLWRCLLVCLFGPMILFSHVTWFLSQCPTSVDEALLSAIHQLGYRLGLSAAMLYALVVLPDLVTELEQLCERLVAYAEQLIRRATTAFQKLARDEQAHRLYEKFCACREVFLLEALCLQAGAFGAQRQLFCAAMTFVPMLIILVHLCERLSK